MDLVGTRRALHQIPEVGFEEFQTQQYLLNFISALPQEHLTVTTWKTGIIVRIEGSVGEKTIGWRTDIDGLPMQEETNLPFASTRPGFMHACGHDCHMTIALSLVHSFAHTQPKQHVIVYFQPAEEGPGGAEPMVKWILAEQPALLADEIYALHIAPEYPVGTVATRPGLLFANTSELNIDIKGLGGHAAYPHKTRDMVVAASSLVMQLQTIVSRNIDPMNSAVISIGKMVVGEVQNVIAEHARLEGTMRTATAEDMATLKRRVEAVCAGIEAAYECEVTIDYASMYYQVNNTERCANALLQFAEQFEGATAYECPAAMTGEDFGYFIKDVPGAMFWAGASSDYGLHHSKLNVDERLLPFNAQFVEQFIRSL